MMGLQNAASAGHLHTPASEGSGWVQVFQSAGKSLPNSPSKHCTNPPAGDLGPQLCHIHTTAALPAFTRYRVRIKRSGELVHTRTVAAPATTHTENSLGWGMYTVEVAAVSDNGVSGQDATTSPLTVGAPGKLAAAPTATGGIGNLTLEWEMPADNPDPANTVFFAKVRISGQT